MKISVSSYSFRQYISAGKMTQLDAVSCAARMGFDAIEFIDLKPDREKAPTHEEQMEYARAIRAEAERCGIEVSSYVVGADLYKGSKEADDAEVQRICRAVDVACELGAKILRHDVTYSQTVNGKLVGFGRMLPTIADNARRITEYASKKGIRTCTENHGFIAQDSDRLEALFYAVDHDNYGLLVDTGNFACVDEDSVKAVSRLAPYAIHAHVKDFVVYEYGQPLPDGISGILTRGCRHLVGCAVGDGDMPTEQCLAILKRAGYDGYVVIEFEGYKDCISEIERGLSKVREYLGRI